MTIKPGTLCYIVGCGYDSWNGRVVTAVKLHPGIECEDMDGERMRCCVWQIRAGWLPRAPNGRSWALPPNMLIPLHDPDADMSQAPDALQDNLLDALQYTRAA